MVNDKLKSFIFFPWIFSILKSLKCIFKVFLTLLSSPKRLISERCPNALRNELGTLGSSNGSPYKAKDVLLWKWSLCNLATSSGTFLWSALRTGLLCTSRSHPSFTVSNIVAGSPVRRLLLHLNLFLWTRMHPPLGCQNNISWKTSPLISLPLKTSAGSLSPVHTLCGTEAKPHSGVLTILHVLTLSTSLSAFPDSAPYMPYVPATLRFSSLSKYSKHFSMFVFSYAWIAPCPTPFVPATSFCSDGTIPAPGWSQSSMSLYPLHSSYIWERLLHFSTHYPVSLCQSSGIAFKFRKPWHHNPCVRNG